METIDYYNKEFIKDVHPLYNKPYIHKIGDLTPDINVIRAKPFGKKISNMQAEDFKYADVWEEHPVYVDDYNQRRTHGNKGINQPHIVGAHKRHYEMDNSEGLSLHEKGPDRTWGYNNKELYSTTGNYDWSLWNKLQ